MDRHWVPATNHGVSGALEDGQDMGDTNSGEIAGRSKTKSGAYYIGRRKGVVDQWVVLRPI